jgi:hypothetical protein
MITIGPRRAFKVREASGRGGAKQAMRLFVANYPVRKAEDFELVAKLIRTGHTPLEVPVSYVSRGFDQGKKVQILRDPLTWVWAIVRFRFIKIEKIGMKGDADSRPAASLR